MPLQTECGLVVYITKTFEIYKNVFNSLIKLQHRGRESFGIGYISEKQNKNYTNFQNSIVEKYNGTIEEEKLSENIKTLNSKLWFGHVRYSTSGIKSEKLNFTQPLQYSLFDLDDINIVYNGNIPLKEWEAIFEKYPELKSFYNRNKSSVNDSFLILEYFKILKNEEYFNYLKKQNTLTNNKTNNLIYNLENILHNILIKFINTVKRAYSLVVITRNKCWIIRDKYGVRPLTIGQYHNGLIIGSESCCFPKNTKILYDIQPGSLTSIDNNTLKIKNSYNFDFYLHDNQMVVKPKHCLFEYLYFMRPETTANKINVQDFRITLGKLLIKEIKEYHTDLYNYLTNIINNKNNLQNNKEIIVCGIPKSGIIQAKSFATNLNVQYLQFIQQKKEYPHRTFILENNQKRNQACHKKYFIEEKHQELIKNKILILIDDSIVRGNTIKYLIEFVNSFNPQEIHFMVSAPPIINICNYGVDFPNIEELIINKKSVSEFKEYLNIKSLIYLKNNILSNLNNNNNNNNNNNIFCLECFNK